MTTKAVSEEEKKEINKQLGATSSVIGAVYAQLYVEKDLSLSKTESESIACLIVERGSDDPPKFIKLYSPGSYKLQFETRIFEGTKYTEENPLLHRFYSTTNALYGLEFQNEDQAGAFAAKVKLFFPSEKKKHDRKKSKGAIGFLKSLFRRGSSRKQTVQQISGPTDFVHKSHIGFDPEKGFSVADLPSEWKALFKEAGIKKKDLKNPETAAAIYETARAEMQRAQTQEEKSFPPPPPPPQGNYTAAPPPPPPPASSDDVPPPPAPDTPPAPTEEAPPAPPAPEAPPAAPEVPTAPAVPVAPPAPAIPACPPVPVAPAVTRKARAQTVAPLKDTSKESRSRGLSTDQAPDHLAAIRQGRSLLKKVVVEPKDDKVMDLNNLDSGRRLSMVSTLRLVMLQRRQAVSDDIEEEESSDDSDWD